MKAEKSELHECNYISKKAGMFGSAADYCFEKEDGSLWVGNDEYFNTVNFCPFCGYKAQKEGATQDIKENNA